ncbi:hypothetical protein [Bacillus solitudinis]|uniref:hypothetical protein n=1 Tax=Bacillus solitudinis TaxID=2014074 RepID=UPI000C24294F|nr:hypothetical protein [Bacillus solitudinis]
MSMCPICNGFEKIKQTCSYCENELIDYGRILDYEGKYSAYEEIEIKKECDEIPNDAKESQCAHYLTCVGCQQSSIFLVQEQ